MVINVASNSGITINLGRQGENDVKHIRFDFSGLAEKFGEGVLSCIVQRKDGDDPYPAVLTYEGHTATWSVSSTDTAYAGTGKIQLSYMVNEQIKKSVIYKTKVEPSILPTSEEPPEPIKNYLDQMVEIGTQVHADAESVSGLASEITETATSAVNTINAKEEQVLQDLSALITFSDDGDGNISITIGGE